LVVHIKWLEIRLSNNCKKQLVEKIKQKRKTQQHRLGTNVRVSGFNAGLVTRSQFASGRSWDRPTRSRFSVVFLGPRANAELVPKFHVALHASHAALPMVTLKISPCTNVTLTFEFDFGLDHLVHGRYGWGSPTPRRRSNCQTNKLKSGYGPQWGPAPRRTSRQIVDSNVTWNWTCVIALQITDPSSRQRGRPTWKIKKVIVAQINVTSGHLLQEGQDTKMNWPTDRRS
jgi:hypothetical protein